MNLYTIPTLPMAAIIGVLSMVFAVVGLYVFKSFGLHPYLRHNNTFTASIYPIIGGIYGVFLAFTVIIAWGHFLEARRSAYREVTHLSELWRDAQVFPDSSRTQIQSQLITYAEAVVNFEWKTMALKGKASDIAETAYGDLWQCYYNFDPEGPQEEIFYFTSLQQLNDVGRHRRRRIMESRSKLPTPMWVFLICGGFLTIFFTYLFDTRHLWLQGLVIALLTWLIVFSLFLVLSLQYPFTGDISVKPLAFQELVHSFKHRNQ